MDAKQITTQTSETKSDAKNAMNLSEGPNDDDPNVTDPLCKNTGEIVREKEEKSTNVSQHLLSRISVKG